MLNSYWEYAGTRYKHKFKVLEASCGNYHDVSFHLFDDPSFKNYDWTVEPAQSLKSLMVERVHQLRDKYDYIKLWFSGGSDSTSVLNTFLTEFVFIDEIVVYRFSPSRKQNLGDYEIDNYAIPYLESIRQQIPHTKINIINFDNDYFEKFLGDKWFHTKNNLSVRHFHTPKINGKNFCNLVCDGEPSLSNINNKWHAELWDTDNYGEFTSYRNMEMFYTTPDMPELHSKQCHMMKNVLIEKGLKERPKYPVWKDLIRSTVRNTPIAPEPHWFRKPDTSTSTNMLAYSLSPKDKIMLRSMTASQRDRVQYQMNMSIGGKKLFRLQHGFVAHSFYLGD